MEIETAFDNQVLNMDPRIIVQKSTTRLATSQRNKKNNFDKSRITKRKARNMKHQCDSEIRRQVRMEFKELTLQKKLKLHHFPSQEYWTDRYMNIFAMFSSPLAIETIIAIEKFKEGATLSDREFLRPIFLHRCHS